MKEKQRKKNRKRKEKEGKKDYLLLRGRNSEKCQLNKKKERKKVTEFFLKEESEKK